MNGTVKWFNSKRGFGFIEAEDGKDYFAHFSAIKAGGYRKLDEGESVRFMPVEEEKGFAAHEIERLSE